MTLIAFEFDGALASRADDGLDPVAADFLRRAANVPGIVLAIASERDLPDLASRIGNIPAYLIASDGLEIRNPHGATLVRSISLSMGLDAEIRRTALRCGFRVEERQDNVALEWGGVPYLGERHFVVDLFREWAAANDLELLQGRESFVARRRRGKEAALRWVTSASAAARVIFAGDGQSDSGALQFAAQKGRAFIVRPDASAAPEGVTVVGTCEQLIRLLRDEVVI